jgi:hypothetical protein
MTFIKILIGNDRYAMFRTGSIEVPYAIIWDIYSILVAHFRK